MSELPQAGGREQEYWFDGDYAQLIDALRQGAELADIAAELQRSVGAVEGRLKYLIPGDAVRGARARESWLRTKLADEPDYDWRAVALRNYAAEERRYWTATDERELIAGWRRRTFLPALAEQLRASDFQVARQLCRLGLAASVTEVVEHLGAAPGSTTEVRARMNADRAAAAVWVLVVDGEGTRIPLFDGQRRHISLHASFDDAQQRLDQLLRQAGRRNRGELRWSLAERTLGEDTYGATHHDLTRPPVAS
ncbi:hypothetical protein [Saccharopolyspora pogona]|uniref:hypothetical protein n=1 Tax=Saccharopolyspora pogona TaxID=333966 RepID=UPI00168729F6|nr:hypothetical protein [Saccharopolyspora pogona]